MTQTRSRLHGLVALALTLALVVMAGIPAVTSGQDKAKNDNKGKATATEATPEPSPTPTPAPTPEPTPYPAFDPSTLTLRLDLYADDFEAPVFIADDGVPAPALPLRGRAWRAGQDHRGQRRLHAAAPVPRHQQAARGHRSRAGSALPSPSIPNSGRTAASSRTTRGPTRPRSWPSSRAGLVARPATGPRRCSSRSRTTSTTTAAGSASGRTASSTSRPATVAAPHPATPRASASRRRHAWARSCASTSTPMTAATASRLTTPTSRRQERQAPGPARLREATWAYGLRDPRRASFDRETGDLWIGDVGQDRFEEINRIPAGATKKNEAFNFGWSDVDGESTCHNLPDCDPAQYEPPVHFYDKVPPHRGVTGGYVYRGELHPGARGRVSLQRRRQRLHLGHRCRCRGGEGFEVPAHQLLDAPRGIVSFGEDDAGELYVVALDGSIYRIEPRTSDALQPTLRHDRPRPILTACATARYWEPVLAAPARRTAGARSRRSRRSISTSAPAPAR